MDEFEDFKNQISSFNIEFSHVICMLIIIIVFVIEFVLIKKGILSLEKDKKKREKAISLNHVVKAHRVKYYDTGTLDSHSHYYAEYEYTINGKTKKYRYSSTRFPVPKITLYYVNSPRRLFHYEDGLSSLTILVYIIPFIVAAILLELFGLSVK